MKSKIYGLTLAIAILLSMIAVINTANATDVGVCVIGVPSPCNGDGSSIFPVPIDNVKVATDKFVYKIGEPVVFTITNTGTTSITIRSEDPVVIKDIKTGDTVYSGTLWCSSGEICLAVVWTYSLEPGKSYTWTWDQKIPIMCITIPCNPVQVPEGIYQGTISGYESNIFAII